MKPVAICVTGWHFPIATYEQLVGIPDARVFVVSHREQQRVPAPVLSMFESEQIVFSPNLGYDWGCFQQFLETVDWKDYAYVVFMHDDVEILDAGFIGASIDLLRGSRIIVGNGRVCGRQAHAPGSYAHAPGLIPHVGFEHTVVRGSYWATTSAAVREVGEFPVHWDRWGWSERFGNCSMRAVSAKFALTFGPDAFAFLSDGYRRSRFLLEDERGKPAGVNGVGKAPTIRDRLYERVIRWNGAVVNTRFDRGSLRTRSVSRLWSPILRRHCTRPEVNGR